MSLIDDWGPEDDHDFPLNLNELSMQELGDISFLFGGVGDGACCVSPPIFSMLELTCLNNSSTCIRHSDRDTSRLRKIAVCQTLQVQSTYHLA